MKYHIWDEKNKTMIEFIEGGDNDLFVNPFVKVMRWSQGGMVPMPRLKPLRWIGLKDRKGRDIYDGDILEFDVKEWGSPYARWAVTWNAEDGSWDTGGGTNSECSGWKAVIGNIYENKELLEDSA